MSLAGRRPSNERTGPAGVVAQQIRAPGELGRAGIGQRGRRRAAPETEHGPQDQPDHEQSAGRGQELTSGAADHYVVPAPPAAPPARRSSSGQLARAGVQSSSRFALALLAPRSWVIEATATRPPTSRPTHAGTLNGGLAPMAAANSGIQS